MHLSSNQPTPPRFFPLIFGLFCLHLIIAGYLYPHVPPGLNGDAARLGLYTVDFVEAGLTPFYIYHQFAPNPFIIYLQTLSTQLFGYTAFALRSVTIFGGALAIPVSYWTAQNLFASEGRIFAERVGLLTTLGLSLSPFFLVFCGYGLEGALMPVITLIALTFLWHGFNDKGIINFALAGIFVGLSQYVYIVARFFPLALALAGLSAILANRTLLRHWRGLLLAGLSASLVALPQWILFIQAPYTFTARTQQNAGQFIFNVANPLSILGAKLVNQLLMLTWIWDNAYNPYSYKPLLTPVLALSLAVGLGFTFYKRGAAAIFSLVLTGLMLLPDLLAVEGVIPSATRLIPALPFIFLMAGLGGAVIWTRLVSKWSNLPWLTYLIPGLVLLFGLFRVGDYVYRVMPQVITTPGLEWRTSLTEIAEADYIAHHQEEAILLPSSEYQRAPLTYLLAEYFPQRQGGLATTLPAGERVTIIQPLAPNRPTTEGIPAGYLPAEWVLLKDETAYFLPPSPSSLTINPNPEPLPLLARNGLTIATVSSATLTEAWPTELTNYQPVKATFENELALVGYKTTPFEAGQPLQLTFYWQPQQPLTADVELFVQLLDREQTVIAGLHSWPLHGAFRVSAWPPNEIMPISYQLEIPADLGVGSYTLIVGVFDLIEHQSLLTSDGAPQQSVTTFKIAPPPPPQSPTTTSEAIFGDTFQFIGYTLNTTPDGLQADLTWQAVVSPAVDYTTFIHLVDENGELVAQYDAQPLGGAYPTRIWDVAEVVFDGRFIPAPPGHYTVYVGWYNSETFEPLPITAPAGTDSEGRLQLGIVEVGR